MSRDLTGRVIAITGASSGIGAATAVACARAGMDVALGARRTDRLEEVAAKVRAFGRQALVVTCDVTSDADVKQFIDRTFTHFNRLDAVFANAGYGLCVPVIETTDKQMHDIFDANFYGTLRCIHAAVPLMLRQGRGHILICTSSASEISIPLYGAYSATKSAQDSIAGALRAELQPDNIHVTSVHPVGTSTEFFQHVVEHTPSYAHVGPSTPRIFRQTSEHVADCIVRCIRRPTPEVWPSVISRLMMGVATAFPRFAAAVLRRAYRRRVAVAHHKS